MVKVRRRGVLLATLTLLSCAHFPSMDAGDRARVERHRQAAADYAQTPICSPREWEGASSVGAILDGGVAPGTAVRVKGALRPTLTTCTLLLCERTETNAHRGYTTADVERYLEPICCNGCGSQQLLVDDDDRAPGSGLEVVGLQGPPVADCSAKAVGEELAVPLLAVGVIPAGSHAPLTLELSRLCRGAIPPPAFEPQPPVSPNERALEPQ